MNKHLRNLLVAGVLASGLMLAHVALATDGGSDQRRDGLTCHNTWSGKTGRTQCSGARGVKWRLRVRCSWQSDYTGPWNYGPGSDSFTCNRGVQSAGVVWG